MDPIPILLLRNQFSHERIILISKLSEHIFLLFSSEPMHQKHEPGAKNHFNIAVFFLISLPVLDLIFALEKFPTKGEEMFLAVSAG